MTNKTYLKLLFLITLLLMLLSCESIKFKYTTGDSKKPLEQSFCLRSNSSMSFGYVKELYFKKSYISNFNTVNGNMLFTYSNDMNPTRIGMTEDMFPPYFKNIKYKIHVKVDGTWGGYEILCSNITLYYNDSLSTPDKFLSEDHQKILECIVQLSTKDLEIK